MWDVSGATDIVENENDTVDGWQVGVERPEQEGSGHTILRSTDQLLLLFGQTAGGKVKA